MKNDQVFQARIDLQTRRKLDALAKKTQRSRSDVIRILIQNGDRIFRTPLTMPVEMPEQTPEERQGDNS